MSQPASTSTTQTKTQRQTNMELMRIVSMLLVLLTHTLFMTNGGPMRVMLNNVMSPTEAFFYTWAESLTLVCVNCFILISGYFGIKVKTRSVVNLLFIVYFYRITLMIIGYISGTVELNHHTLYRALYPFMGDWFVPAYIGLMLLSPLLNAMVEISTQKQLKKYLAIYMSLMVLLSVLPSEVSFTFNCGYSALSFVGIYMLARYFRLYATGSTKWSKKTWLCLYVVSALIPAILYFLVIQLPGEIYIYYHDNIFCSYNSPFNLFGAFCLLVIFSKLHLNNNTSLSRIINRTAMSAFSVFIIHLNPTILPYYKDAAAYVINTYPFAVALPILIVWVILVYLAIALIDSIRIFLWKCIDKHIKWNRPNKESQTPAFE